jgi:nucleoside-diphosphate-sugar epimerase
MRRGRDLSPVSALAVTGASGFVGREFVRSTRELGWTVVPLGRGELVSGLERRLVGCESLVHIAGRAHVLEAGAAADTAEFDRSNVELTREVARAARSAAVRRLVFVSSAGVLGSASPPEGFNDDSPTAPHDAYTRSKLAAECMLRVEFARDLEVVVVRPPLVYGPDAPGNFGRLLRLVRRGWPLPFGGLDARRSMVGLRNLCDFLRLATAHSAAPGLSMLVADAESPSVAELAVAFGCALGNPTRLLNVPPPVLRAAFAACGRGRDFERLTAPFLVRPRLALEALGWTPPYRFAQELAWSVGAAGPSAP